MTSQDHEFFSNRSIISADEFAYCVAHAFVSVQPSLRDRHIWSEPYTYGPEEGVRYLAEGVPLWLASGSRAPGRHVSAAMAPRGVTGPGPCFWYQVQAPPGGTPPGMSGDGPAAAGRDVTAGRPAIDLLQPAPPPCR